MGPLEEDHCRSCLREFFLGARTIQAKEEVNLGCTIDIYLNRIVGPSPTDDCSRKFFSSRAGSLECIASKDCGYFGLHSFRYKLQLKLLHSIF